MTFLRDLIPFCESDQWPKTRWAENLVGWVLVIIMGGAGFAGCSGPVNLATFSIIPKAKLLIEQRTPEPVRAGDVGRVPFATHRKITFTVRNAGNIPAPTLHFRVQSESSVDGPLFSIGPDSSCRDGMSLSQIRDQNTCSLSVVFKAPVPQTLDELPPEGKLFQGQLTLDYDSGYTEADEKQSRRIQLDLNLAARVTAEPSFSLIESYVSDLPIGSNPSSFVTRDRVLFDSNSLASNTGVSVSNPDYDGTSIQIPVRFNGSLLPRSECQKFKESLSDFAFQGFSVQNQDCVKNDLIIPLLPGNPGLHGVPNQADQWITCSESMRTAGIIHFKTRAGTDWLSCNPTPSDMTSISAHLNPMEIFKEQGDEEYLTVKKLRSVISLVNNPSELTVVEVMAQAPKVSLPNWETVDSNIDIAELAITSSLTPSAPPGYRVNPSLSWTSRLSSLDPNLSGLARLRAQLNRAEEYQIEWSGPSQIEGSGSNCESGFDASSNFSTSSLSIPSSGKYEISASQLSSVLTWLPNHSYRACIRAVDAFGNRSTHALNATKQSQDIPPLHFLPALNLSQVNRSNQLTLKWVNDSEDAVSTETFGKLHHYQYRVLPQSGTPSCTDRTDFTSVNATTITCSVNGAGDCTGTADLTAESFPGTVCVLIQACNLEGNCIPSLHEEDEVSNARQSVSLIPPDPSIMISSPPSPRARFDSSGEVGWFWSVQYRVTAYPSPSPSSSIVPWLFGGTAGMSSSLALTALTSLSLHSVNTSSGTNCTTSYPNCKQFSGSFSDSYYPAAPGPYTVQYQSSPLTTFTITAHSPFELTAASINAESKLTLNGSAMVAENLDHYEVDSWKKVGNSCAPPQGTLFTWNGPSSSANGPSPFPSVVPSFTSTSLSACSTYGIYCAQIKACDSAAGAGKLCATRGAQSFFYDATGNPVIRPSPSVSPSSAISPSPSPMVSTLADGSTRIFRVFTWNPKFELDVPLSATVSSIDVRRKLDTQSYARIPSGKSTATYVADSLPTADTSCGRKIYRIGLQANDGAQTSVEVGIQPDDFNDHTVCYQIVGTYTLQGDTTPRTLTSSDYCYTFSGAQNSPTVTWSPSPTPSSRFNRLGAIQRLWRIQGRIISNAHTLTLNDLRLKRTIQATTVGSTPSAWLSPLPGPSALPSCSDFVSSISGPWCYELSLNETSASTSDEQSRAEASQKLDIPSSSSTEFLNDSNYQSITSSRMLNYRLDFPGNPTPSLLPSWSVTIPPVGARFQLNSLTYDGNTDGINLTATPMGADSLDHYKLESWLKPPSGICSDSQAQGLHSWTSSTASLPNSVHFSNMSPNFASCIERIGLFCTRLKACNADDSVCASSSGLTVNRTQNATAAPTITVTQSQPPTLGSRLLSSDYRVLTWSWSSRATLVSSGNLTGITIQRAHLSGSSVYPNDNDVKQQTLSPVISFNSADELTGTIDCTGRTTPILSYTVNSPVENTYDLSSTYGWTAGADFAYHKICYKYTATNSAGSSSDWYCVPFHFEPPKWNGSASPTPTSTFNSQGLITWTWPIHGQIVGGSCSLTFLQGLPGTLSRSGILSGESWSYAYPYGGNDLEIYAPWYTISSTPGAQISISATIGGNPIVNFPSTLIAPSPSPFSVTSISYDANRDSIQFIGNKMSADSLSKYIVKIWKPSTASPTCTSSPGPSDTIASPLAIGTNSSMSLPTDVPIWTFFNYSEAPINNPGTVLCANVAAADDSDVVYTAPMTSSSPFIRSGSVAIAPSNRPTNLQDWVFNWTSYFGDGLTTPTSPDTNSAIRHWEWSVPFRYESTNTLNQLRWKRMVQTRTSLEHDWNSASIPPDTNDSMWSAAGNNTLSSPAQEHPSNCGTPCQWNLYQTSIADSSQGLWTDSDDQPTYKRVCYQITADSNSNPPDQTYLCHTFQVGPKYQPTCTPTIVPTIFGSITYGASCNFLMNVSRPYSYTIDIAAGYGSCSNLATRPHHNANRSATDTQYSFWNQEILGFASSSYDVRNCLKIDACESKKDESGTHCTHLPFTQF